MLTPPPRSKTRRTDTTIDTTTETPHINTTPLDSPHIATPSWRQVIQTYGVASLLPILFWTVANPIQGTVALAGIATAALGVKRLGVLTACLRHCGEFALDLGETARVTVSQPPTNDACC